MPNKTGLLVRKIYGFGVCIRMCVGGKRLPSRVLEVEILKTSTNTVHNILKGKAMDSALSLERDGTLG